MIKIYLPIFLLISFVFIISISFLYEEEIVAKNISGSVMGTTYNINLQIDNPENIESSIGNIFGNVNEEMSTYIEDSMISRVNKSVIGEWTPVDKDFIEVLVYATTLCIKTDGVYDVTIGKIVDSWGFGPEEVKEKPKKNDLRYFQDQIGCNSIEFDHEKFLVKKLKDIALDFSSIAKGFAIDKAFLYLKNEEKIKSFMVELGGEIRTTSLKPDRKAWKVGVINPLNPSAFIHIFYSDNHESFAMATSGDYMNIRIFNDEKYSHTIDSNALPSEFKKKSVSVISTNTMKADALATALNAMELNQAIIFAEKNNIKALFVTEENNEAKLIFSKELQKVKI